MILMTLAKGFVSHILSDQDFCNSTCTSFLTAFFLFIKRSSILDTLDLLDCCVSKMARLADLEKKAVQNEYVE